VRREASNVSQLRLHFGCGPRHLAGWVNVDLFHSSADLHLDLRRPLPWRNDQVDAIYSEHFIEHLSFPQEIKPFLAECWRVLRAGGVFQAGLPDAEKVLVAYSQRDEAFFERQRRWHPGWARTPMEHINYTFRQGDEHKWAYDFETLRLLLEGSGFVNVQRRPWNEEFDSLGWENSLYVVAAKPSNPTCCKQ
jgi:predicted SAM-dependent methyltransferase